MQARIPIQLGGVTAVVAGVVLMRAVPADAPIPAGYASIVDDARTSLLTLDGAPGLGFERLECTADGGYVVWFHGSSLLDGTRVFVADSVGPYVAGDWGGGVAELLGEDTGYAHGPIVACG